MQTLVANKSVAFDLPVRILMVTCRPDGAGFIDPRSIATPFLAALDAIPEQVEVEFLRPPTLSALDDRLRDETKPRVHIVHFDGHGVYDKGVGLGFLLFEDENHQKHHGGCRATRHTAQRERHPVDGVECLPERPA